MLKLLEKNKGEEGFVLVLALMMLLVLTIFGIAALNTTTTEFMIAGNDALHKKTFYRADGGADIGASILEENIACITGFTPDADGNLLIDGGDGDLVVEGASLNFWLNDPPAEVSPSRAPPSDGNRDVWFRPNNWVAGGVHTNFTIGGNAKMVTGAALQMAAGYEGKGKGIGGGGALMEHHIYAQRVDVNNAEAVIHLHWRHIIGQEGECGY
ncbi:MAG: PilX N-terminal domain-containing pilus assembly protein [Thermodesulfobacteriota bacterium]